MKMKNKLNTKGDGSVSVEEEVQPTISEHISFAIGHLNALICQHSYIFSNITMMVSSINMVLLNLPDSKYFPRVLI